MAKKIAGYVKLQIPAGKATPAPPVGTALGQHGVNIVNFTKSCNGCAGSPSNLWFSKEGGDELWTTRPVKSSMTPITCGGSPMS